MLGVGSAVIDRVLDEQVEVRHVRFVPRTVDLFGAPVPPHRVLTVRYFDGRAAERRETELEPVTT